MQMDLSELMYDYFKFEKRPVRLVETFAGVGTQKMAFDKAGIDCEVVAIVEVDKYAVESYAAIHTDYLEVRKTYFNDHNITKEEMVKVLQDKNLGFNFETGRHTINERTNEETVRNYYLADLLTKNLGDISKVKGEDLPKDIDMLTYSFPCQDLSRAGKGKGMSKNTRSGLVFQVFRIIDELEKIDNKPKTLLMENVTALIHKEFVKEFVEMKKDLEQYGYTNDHFTMNARHYGVAQNRDRVFMLSFLGKYSYSRPPVKWLDKKLTDYLEEIVDDSYYIDEKLMSHIIETGKHSKNYIKYDRYNGEFESLCRVWKEISPTLRTNANEIKILEPLKIKEATKKGYSLAEEGDGIYINRPHQKRGVVQKDMIQTLKTSGSDVGVVVKKDEVLKVRKLTPLECWRLMGISDENYYKAEQVNSNTQLYKQAGNAIVVDVLVEIFKQLV